MRSRGAPLLKVGRGRGLLLFAAWLLPAASGGCEEKEVEPRNPPDALLRDSLGLTDEDHVFRVTLSVEQGENVILPRVLEVPRGAWVEFVTSDGWPRTVAFELDSLPSAASELLRARGEDASPPLLDPGTRFVVSLEGAPAGRYPYRVEGSAQPAEGVLVVQEIPEGG